MAHQKTLKCPEKTPIIVKLEEDRVSQVVNEVLAKKSFFDSCALRFICVFWRNT